MRFNPAWVVAEDCLKNKLIFSVGIQHPLPTILRLAMTKYLASNLKGRRLYLGSQLKDAVLHHGGAKSWWQEPKAGVIGHPQ